MGEFFRNGGFSMYPVLGFGMLTLAAAAHFALRAERKTKTFVESMAKVVGFAAAAGLLSGLAEVFNYMATKNVAADRFGPTLAQGLYEALSPAIMGTAFLAMIFLFVAIGQRRFDARHASA